MLFPVVREHHSDPVPQGKILPREVKAFAALVGPGRANARPDFLALLVLACGLAVVEDVGWSVRHRNLVSATDFQCRGLATGVNVWRDLKAWGAPVDKGSAPGSSLHETRKFLGHVRTADVAVIAPAIC